MPMTPNGVAHLSGIFNNIASQWSKMPLLEKQAEMQAGLQAAQTYNATQSGRLNEAKAGGENLTLEQRRHILGGGGPAIDLPEFVRQGLVVGAIGGDFDPAKITQASGNLQTQAFRKSAADNVGNLDTMNRWNTLAQPGQTYEPFAVDGNNGRAVDKATGRGVIYDQPMATNFDSVKRADANQKNGAAASSYASARKYSTEADMEGEKLGILRKTGSLPGTAKAGGASAVIGYDQQGNPIYDQPQVKLTEDQGKATGWLAQATNAFNNMNAVLEKDKSAAYPGVNDAIAAFPSFGAGEALANTLRSPNRQKFMQASSSLSEALLRAATGAGVNRDEAAQKIRELTPVFGEKEGTTKQKLAAIPMYIESLKVRAGPGAGKIGTIMSASSPAAKPTAAPSIKFLGFE